MRLSVVLLVLAVAACQPTGDPRCDQYPDALAVIESRGWTVNCAPHFAGYTPGGMKIAGWADSSSRTVFVWPDHTRHLHRTLLHEAGHVLGYGETRAALYAYCHLPPGQRSWANGPTPTAADCRTVL